MTCAWRSSRIAAVAIAMAACGPKDAPVDPALEGLAITALAPATVVPGSRITVTGRSFVDAPWGAASVHLFGNTADGAIDIHVAADFVDYDHLEIAVTDLVWDKLGGEGDFAGHAQVEIESGVTGETYRSAAIPVSLAIRAKLIPTIASLDLGEVAFVNDPVTVTGNGLLLGGGEGDTVARVSGCFTADGATDCAAIEPVSIPVIAAGPRPRETGTFVLSPTIAGISPGHFAGEVVLENHHATGQVQASEAVPMAFDLTRPAVF
ncbi:MAG TPA: hypothetical protein VFG83_12800, partial [Kofleriaceae bacterium]|nr:hypothetical protein [Kofleriaceae bacterium]